MKSTSPSSLSRIALAVSGLICFGMIAGCKSERTKQLETELVKRSSAPQFTKEIYSELLAKEQKKKSYPEKVYRISGKIVRIETEQTEQGADLELTLRLWPDSDIKAFCEFDARSLKFVKNCNIGETVHLKALLSNVSENSVFVVGATVDLEPVTPAP